MKQKVKKYFLVVMTLLLLMAFFKPVKAVWAYLTNISFPVGENATCDVRDLLMGRNLLLIRGQGAITEEYAEQKLKNYCESTIILGFAGNFTEIGDNVFRDFTQLSGVGIPNSVERIGDYAFAGCSGFSKINLPSGLTELGKGAFSDCTTLGLVFIPEGITELKAETFQGCSLLMEIIIPTSVKHIDKTAFADCNDSVIFHVRKGSFAEKYAIENNINYEIIADELFFEWDNLDTNSHWRIDKDGVLTVSGQNVAFNNKWDFSNYVKKLVVEEGIQEIGECAFFYCQLGSVSLPSSLKKIGDGAFEGTALESIEISETVTEIGARAFADCVQLKTVVIPKTVTRLGAEVFSGCLELSKVTIPNSVEFISENTFLCCDLERITLYVEAGSYAENFAKENNIKYVILGSEEEQPIEVVAPTNLTATADGNSVAISWDMVPSAELYALYMKRTNGETVLVNNRLTDTTCTINNLAAGTKVGFVVKAYGNGKWSGWSSTAWATPTAPEVVAPTNLKAVAGNGTVSLTWSAVPGAKCYAIFLKRTNGEVVLIDNRVTTNSYNLSNLANGTTLGFIVKAYGNRKWSGWSATVWATPSLPIVAPSNVLATAGNKTITVTWDAVPGAQVYALFLKRANGEVVLVDNRVSGTSYTLNNLTNGTSYGFVVKTYIAKTWSGWSSTSWATPFGE